MPSTGPETQVACALIWRNEQILLSKRHRGTHLGGLWEFPGGKFESGEEPMTCLSRELKEELDIVLVDASFMFQIPWNYGEKSVRLWVYEVSRFDGEPRGLEGQDVSWFPSEFLTELQFPRANDAIIRAVGLPRITKILDAKFAREPKTWVREMHDRSVLYLRGLPPGRDLEGAIGLAIGKGHQVILTLDQLTCFQEGCGVHLRKNDEIQDALECLKALDRPWPLTSGIRDESDIVRQRDWPSDAVFISPVRQTSSHFGLPALGWNRFSELACDLGVPAYALGGMTKSDIEVVKRYWGFGVAGISGFQ